MGELERRELLRMGVATVGWAGLAAWLSGCASSAVSSGSYARPDWPDGQVPPVPKSAPVSAPPSAPASRGAVVLAGVNPRSTWTRASPRMRDANPMNGINRITIHHDGMPPTAIRSKSDVARRLDQVRRSHLDRGWADIGYHYIIDPRGEVWEGRPINLQGAHVQDNNEHNLGILVLGNFDQQTPTSAQLSALDAFVANQMRSYRVPLGRVYTHQEIRPTACPGRNLQRYMLSTRASRGNLRLTVA
jgi:hypothetical protein